MRAEIVTLLAAFHPIAHHLTAGQISYHIWCI